MRNRYRTGQKPPSRAFPKPWESWQSLYFLWFWSQPPPFLPIPKRWKCWQAHAFRIIMKPIAALPPTSKDMKMMTVPCISHHPEASHPFPPTSKTNGYSIVSYIFITKSMIIVSLSFCFFHNKINDYGIFYITKLMVFFCFS